MNDALKTEPTKSVYTVRKRYFRLERRDLVYLTFILEAYEGLATLSTVDRKETLVSITTLPGGAADLDLLIAALQEEITLTEVPAPPAEGNGGEHA